MFIRLFVAYLGRHPSSQEMQTSLQMMAVLSKSQRGNKKWRWPAISVTGVVPTTRTFVDVDLPGKKCLEWNPWLILVLGRQRDMLQDLSGIGKNVSFGNRIHLGARYSPC